MKIKFIFNLINGVFFQVFVSNNVSISIIMD